MTLFRHALWFPVSLAPMATGGRIRTSQYLIAAILVATLFVLAPQATVAQTCAGDCNGDGQVSVDEMIVAANVVLGTLDVRACPGIASGSDGAARIDDAVAAVRGSLGQCGSARAASPRDAGTPAQIELGVVSGSAGAQVTFTATLHDMGNVVAGTQNDISFDPRTPITGCEENPAINKGAFVGFQPPGCTLGVNCTGVRVIVLSLSDVDPIPDGSVLYSCHVAIDLTAPDGTYPLVSTNEGASTPDGQFIETEGIDGAVIVAGGGFCAGDCNASGNVAINELINGIYILGNSGSLASCAAADINGSGTVTVDESVAATGNALGGCGTSPSGPFGSETVQIALDSVTGVPGTLVAISATLHAGSASVAGTQNDISVDPLTPIANCDPNPAIDKGATTFFYSPDGCTLGFDCTGVRVLVTALDNTSTIPDGSVLYSCTLAVDALAPDGTYPVFSTDEGASTPGGRPVPVVGIDGAVIVGNGSSTGTRIVAGSTFGIPGQEVSFGVGLETDEDVAGTENELAFDLGAPIVFTSCQVNPDINKPQTAFAFRPNSCIPGTNCSGVKALVLSFFNLDPIPNGSTMYTCDVLLMPEATPGDYPINCFAPGAATPDGNAIDTDCVNGQVTILPGGPPVAPASLILQRARLRANTATAPRASGVILLAGVVNANAPFDGLSGEILAGGVSVDVAGAGGVDFALAWAAGQCTSQQTSRGPKIRCEAEDANGKRRLSLRPTRIPNVFKLTLDASNLALAGPFTDEAVSANLATTSFQRPDSIDSCALHRQGVVSSCRETGIVP